MQQKVSYWLFLGIEIINKLVICQKNSNNHPFRKFIFSSLCMMPNMQCYPCPGVFMSLHPPPCVFSLNMRVTEPRGHSQLLLTLLAHIRSHGRPSAPYMEPRVERNREGKVWESIPRAVWAVEASSCRARDGVMNPGGGMLGPELPESSRQLWLLRLVWSSFCRIFVFSTLWWKSSWGLVRCWSPFCSWSSQK